MSSAWREPSSTAMIPIAMVKAYHAAIHAGLPMSATNQALRHIGVIKGDTDVDEFMAVGLSLHRSTVDWAAGGSVFRGYELATGE